MMRFLLTHLRAKLMVLVMLPLAAGAALTFLFMYRQNEVVQSLAPLTATSRLGATLGDLVHALQAERGSTALYQGARGQGSGEELRARRQATDQAVEAFRAALPSAPPEAQAQEADQALQRLPALRGGVEAGRSATVLLDDYTALIGVQLALVDRLVLPAAATTLESRFHALSALMHQKEQAELERAVLANAFSNQAFAPGMKERFLGLVAVQDAQGQAFLRSAPAAWREAYAQGLRGAAEAPYLRLRDQALASAAKLPDIDPFLWFRTATERLEAFKALEVRFNRQLVAEAEGMETSALRTRLALLAGALLFGALVLTWTHVTGEAVLKPIQTLEEGFERLRNGDLSVRLPIVGQDETARMTGAFNTTCEQLGLMTRRLKEAAHRVAGGAHGLSQSADRVSGSTQQLARSAFSQRQATEQVASAMLQLSASVQQVEDTLHAVRAEGHKAADLARGAQVLGREAKAFVEGIRERSERAVQASALITELGRRLTQALANLPHDGVRQALERSIQASEAAATLAKENGTAVAEGRDRLEALAGALEGTLKALTAVDRLTEEIDLVARDQAAASREVSQRMQDTSKGTGEVQLAAAQLANTVPEVHLTAQELAGVAQGLASTADAFVLA